MQLETVKVVDSTPGSDTGWKIINKADLTDTDKLYKEPKTKPAEQPDEQPKE